MSEEGGGGPGEEGSASTVMDDLRASMQITGSHVIDRDSILRKAYRLLSIFLAAGEIERRNWAAPEVDGLKLLEHRFFAVETSSLLVEIAASFRVLDDQIWRLPSDDPQRIVHIAKKYDPRVPHQPGAVAAGFFMKENAKTKRLEGAWPMSIRDVCNKIIHADVIQHRTRPGVGPHGSDQHALFFDLPLKKDWEHISEEVVLSGIENRRRWITPLSVVWFVRVLVYQLSDTFEENPGPVMR